jgi:RNA polymerase sigma-70 factor (sigma-E family)
VGTGAIRRPISREVSAVSTTTIDRTVPPPAAPASFSPAGTVASFEEYVERRRHALLRTAHALCRDPHRAEDLVQSALEHTYSAWPRIRDARAVDAYVRRAMYHEHVGAWRRTGQGAEVSAAEVPERSGSAADGSGLSFDERQELWALVCRLPPRQRTAVVLRYYEDLSEAQTARLLDCAVGTVKSNTSRGLATLRALAREWSGQEPDAA